MEERKVMFATQDGSGLCLCLSRTSEGETLSIENEEGCVYASGDCTSSRYAAYMAVLNLPHTERTWS